MGRCRGTSAFEVCRLVTELSMQMSHASFTTPAMALPETNGSQNLSQKRREDEPHGQTLFTLSRREVIWGVKPARRELEPAVVGSVPVPKPKAECILKVPCDGCTLNSMVECLGDRDIVYQSEAG